MVPVAAPRRPGTKDKTMKLLHIDSSILGEHSASRALSAAVVAARKAADPSLELVYRDLAASPLPHLSGASLAKADPAEVDAADQVMRVFLEADVVVVGAPMYNFTIASTV
jgi:FMN-dependent NADH-azoreductase